MSKDAHELIKQVINLIEERRKEYEGSAQDCLEYNPDDGYEYTRAQHNSSITEVLENLLDEIKVFLKFSSG